MLAGVRAALRPRAGKSVAAAVAAGAAAAGTRGLASAATVPSTSQDVVNFPPTRVSTLGNGFRVASEDSDQETATVGVWIDAGSRFENDKNNGVAHFLEHLAFKGTNKRTQRALELEIENMGGHLNAYTSREQTVYYAKVFKRDVPRAVEILADIIRNSKFEAAAVERERDVILREMQEVESHVDEVVFDRLHEAAYDGSALSRTILGPVENIQSIQRADLVEYVDTHYTAPRMVLAAAGGVDHDALVASADQYFGDMSAEMSAPPTEATAYAGGMVSVWKPRDEMPLVHLALSFEGVGAAHKDYYTLLVMQTMLGAWDRAAGSGKAMASRLCSQVAQHDLAHSVMSFNTSYTDTGLFGVYAVAEPEKAEDIVWLIENEMVRMAFKASAFEVERAKNQLKANILMQLDHTSNIAEDIGRSMLIARRRLTPAEIFARIDAIDVNDVKAAAAHYIYDRDVSVAAVGATDALPDYTWIRGWTYWLSA